MDSRSSGWDWKTTFAWVVAVAVTLELFSDAAIWVSSDALQAIADGEIETLRAQNNEMKAAFAWRNLDQDQQRSIAFAVRRFGAIPYDTAIANEPESLNLLNQIMVALGSAGWVKKHCNCSGASIRDNEGRATSVTLLGQGVDIEYDPSSTDAFGAAADALANALNENGIKASAAPAQTGLLSSDNVHIRVASKPR